MTSVQESIRRSIVARFFTIGLIAVLLGSSSLPAFSQRRISGVVSGNSAAKKLSRKERERAERERKQVEARALAADRGGRRTGEKIVVEKAAEKTTAEIMGDQLSRGVYKSPRELLMERGLLQEREGPERDDRPDGPGALPESRYPYPTDFEKITPPEASFAPQTVGTQFDGATGPTETGAFPPDTNAAVGPTQVFVFLNGRLRTFNKTTGVADGFVNADSDVFFASVMTPPLAGEVVISTDPNVRFDRNSNRWILNMIDAPLNAATGATTRVNRIMFAISDAASNGNISGSTVWTFYQFTGDATLFTDYESLGIDQTAMYVGGNMFTLAGSFSSTKGWVIPKAPALTGSPLTVWAFSGLVATPTGAGPWSPRGVDNPDPANTGPTATGYFIGPDNATFNTLMIRRVTDPSNTVVSPTISANISVATPLTTRFPVLVPHLGNTGGTNGRLDALDDRLYSAMIRNGRLWTSHNIGVNNTGVAGATNNRNAVRWYELQNLGTTPSVLQSGTLFDNNATNDANQRNYWIPSIAVSGQGHAALGCSIAGTNERVNAFTTGRLVGDTLGTLRDGPGGTAFPGYTASSTAYNPPGDPGGPSRRWGDYSLTTVDPKDDMTMWTVQQYTNGTNTYGVRVAKLIAPPPPNIADGPGAGGNYNVNAGLPSVNVTITGAALPAGSGFYDPGANPAAPHTPFTHISATVTAPSITVNSTTYNSPTSVTLNLNTVGAALGLHTINITNPDGQVTSRTNLNVMAASAAPADIGGRVSNSSGQGIGRVTISLVSSDGTVRMTAITNAFGYYRFVNVPTGRSYILTPSTKGYHFSPPNLIYNHEDEATGLDFIGNATANRKGGR